MKNIKELILDVTALDAEILSYEYDDENDLYYVFCSCASHLCHIELSEDGNHVIIYTDDIVILYHISYILDSMRNRKSFMYANDLYNLNEITQCISFKYALKCVSDQEYQKEYYKEIGKERIKGR